MNTSLVNPSSNFSKEQIAANYDYNQNQTMTRTCHAIVLPILNFLSFRDFKAVRACRSLDQVIIQHTAFHNHLLNNMLKPPFNYLEDVLKFIEKRGSSIKTIILKSTKLSFTNSQLQIMMEKCPHLITLQIENQKNMTDEGLKNLQLMTKLTHLKIAACNRLTSQSVQYLRPLKKLKSLFLADHPITDTELNRLTQSLNQLELFSLTDCNEITNRGLSYLNILKLTALHLTRIDKINERGMENIRKLNHLKSFSLVDCKQINNKALNQIDDLKNLVFLDLTASQVTDQTVERLVKLENLKIFILKNCEGITANALKSIEKFEKLEILKLEGSKIKNVGSFYLKSLNTLM